MRTGRANTVIARMILLTGLIALGLGAYPRRIQAGAKADTTRQTLPDSSRPHLRYFSTPSKVPSPLGNHGPQRRAMNVRGQAQVLTFTVSSTADFPDATPGDGICDTGRSVPPAPTSPECTLRAAIQEATAVSGTVATIVLPAGTYFMTQTSGFGCTPFDVDLCVGNRSQVAIEGAGASTTIIDGSSLNTLIGVQTGTTLTVSGATMTHGNAPGGTGIGGGGFQNRGTLALSDSVVNGNQAGFIGGGIYSSGMLTLLRTVISGNSTQIGGGLFNDGGTVTLQDSTIADNGAQQGGGIFNSNTASSPGGPGNVGTITATGCTISGNNASTQFAGGAAMFENNFSVITLINCTISGNTTQGSGGGIEMGDSAIVNLNNVTIANNTAGITNGAAGGVDASFGTLSLSNTIIADNTGGSAPDCQAFGPVFGFSSLNSLGHNLIGNTANCSIGGDTTGNVTGVDPKLGPLANNGGPTQTQALSPGSPAIDKGNPAPPGSGGTACAATDQRGVIRPRGLACDMGAFEASQNFAVSGIFPSQGGNSGPVLTTISGSGFLNGASAKLLQGNNQIVASQAAVELGQSAISASFDLTAAAVGVWDVEVSNPDGTSATIPGAFTVATAQAPNLFVDLVSPSRARPGQPTLFYVVYGNRGNVDAAGVTLTISVPAGFTFGMATTSLTAPPPQPGQVTALDWSLQPVDVLPDSNGFTNVPLLLPVVPAGYIGQFNLSITPPTTAQEGQTFTLFAGIGGPLLATPPAPLDHAFVNSFVQGAVDYAQNVVGETIASSSLLQSISQYATTSLQSVVTSGRSQLVSSINAQPQIYSLAWLQLDAALFAAAQAAAGNQATSLLAPMFSSFDEAAGSLPSALAPVSAQASDKICPIQKCGGILPQGCSCISGGDFPPLPPIPVPPDCPIGQKNIGLSDLLKALAKCKITKDQCEALPNHHVAITPDGKQVCVPDTTGPECPQINFPNPGIPSGNINCIGTPIADSIDPNSKQGSVGVTSKQLLVSGLPLTYTIHFENQASATAPAQTVAITDPLDSLSMDLSTLNLGNISFGNITIPLPPGVDHYQGGIDLRPAQNIIVLIDAGLDKQTGIITWNFTSVYPLTLQQTTDALAGFLPPNTNPPQGEGTVAFTVQPKTGVGNGTPICNQGQIVFDQNPAIPTPKWCNGIDTLPPQSRVSSLPRHEFDPNFTLEWSGTDPVTQILDFSIFVSDNGGPFTAFQTDTNANSAIFPGEVGHTYGFFSRARNLAGVVEPLKNQPDTITRVKLLPFSLSVKPRILHFGKVPVHTQSEVKKVTLTNRHRNKVGVLIEMVTDSGTRPVCSSCFSETNNCPNTLEAGAKCKIKVTFNPDGIGLQKGKLVVTDNAHNSPQTVLLRGHGK